MTRVHVDFLSNAKGCTMLNNDNLVMESKIGLLIELQQLGLLAHYSSNKRNNLLVIAEKLGLDTEEIKYWLDYYKIL